MRSREIIWKGKSLKHDRSISIRYTIFYTCTILFLRNIKTREASTFPYLYRRSISVEIEVLRSIKIRLELESRCQKDIYMEKNYEKLRHPSIRRSWSPRNITTCSSYRTSIEYAKTKLDRSRNCYPSNCVHTSTVFNDGVLLQVRAQCRSNDINSIPTIPSRWLFSCPFRLSPHQFTRPPMHFFL